MTSMTEVLEAHRGSWRFVWHGGRLADVYHAEGDSALDCVQVCGYDWQAGKITEPFVQATLEEAADKWVRNSGEDFSRELPYLL